MKGMSKQSPDLEVKRGPRGIPRVTFINIKVILKVRSAWMWQYLPWCFYGSAPSSPPFNVTATSFLEINERAVNRDTDVFSCMFPLHSVWRPEVPAQVEAVRIW